VTVNLATGSATNVNNGAAGAVTNLQNVIGSASGTNILTGDAQGNILTGGSGLNTLVGGSGGSLLIGGSGHGIVAAELPGAGVWRYEDGAGWARLTGIDASSLAVDASGDVAAAFPGSGVGATRTARAGSS
jgi:Ca2+-binding RTX toxin-like protein